MQFHLIAFTPFIVLAGTGLAVTAISLVLRFRVSRVEAAGPAVRYSAEILTFPAPKALPVVLSGRTYRKTGYAVGTTAG